MAGEHELELHLQKAFPIAFKAVEDILKFLSAEETETTLVLLTDYLEQFRCCQRVNLSDSPLAQYEDLTKRLLYKISTFIEKHVMGIRNIIKQLEDCCAKIANEQVAVMRAYGLLGEQLSPVTLTRGTPLRPPLALIMEWLADLDQDAFFILGEKRHLVNQLDFQSEETINKLNKNWAVYHGLGEKLTNMKRHLHFFILDKS